MDLTKSEIGVDEPKLEGEEDTGNEPDLPPEYCHYRDEGCEFADACLHCPFPHCLYDEPRGKQRWLKGLRNREITQLFGSGEWGIKELASLFGLSQRTIQRALKSTLSVPSGHNRKAETGKETG
jgi:AraC-like DNA-binding protein